MAELAESVKYLFGLDFHALRLIWKYLMNMTDLGHFLCCVDAHVLTVTQELGLSYN